MHHCAPVKAWVAEHSDLIELVFLPSYSPERNPDEYLNGDFEAIGPPKRVAEPLAKVHFQ